ncbi:MAG: prephenate dehydratase [Acidobacteria bacterium]|nr:prephenate dehydratase [Acidobacteriota bacterium]
MDLGELRARIDALDDAILRLLNERAGLAAQVGELKRGQPGSFYVPSRERAIVARLQAANPGPFPSEALRPVFQEIFSACLALEKGLRIAFLGPEGTFTHQAMKHQFGLSAHGVPAPTIAAVFDEVEKGRAEFGVVPIENSTEGVVTHTLDTILDSDLRISAEIVLDVDHCLLGRPALALADIQRVYSHAQGLGQCRRWLEAHLPEAARIEAPSTGEAARLAREDAAGAAVAPELAADLHDLVVLQASIQDLKANATRFLVIGKEQAAPTGRDRTSLMVITKEGPGVLHEMLGPFADAGLNLTKIESRPSRRKAWENVFFLDVDGHQALEPLASALQAMGPHCEMLKVLGSYPRAGA